MTRSQLAKLPSELRNQSQAIKRGGGRVFIVIPELVGDEATKLCVNCNGVGNVGIQWFTGGPYESAPACQNKADPEGSQNVPSRATAYNDKWYMQKTRTALCPVCNGTGEPQRVRARAKALAF